MLMKGFCYMFVSVFDSYDMHDYPLHFELQNIFLYIVLIYNLDINDYNWDIIP